MAEHSGPLFWSRVLALSAHLLVFPVGAGMAVAGDGPTSGPASTTSPATPKVAEPAAATPGNTTTAPASTIDEAHDTLERNILEKVIDLDNFFGNTKTESQQKTEYQIRWRSSLRIDEEGKIDPGTTLYANLQLSRINDRLHLVVFGDNEPDRSSSSLPQDPGNPGLDRNTQSVRFINTELRYGIIKTPTLDMFVGAGVRLVIPPEAFVRGRFQSTHKFSKVSLLRFSETVFAKNLDGPGETTEIDLERLLDRKTILRWANTGTVAYNIRGLEWGTELSLIRELSPRSAITLIGGVYGNTSIDDAVLNYRVLARYRRNFLRSWLFYELEPEISWPRLADGSFDNKYTFTFRLEVVFQGKEK